MTLVAHIDYETASLTDLTKTGVYKYVEDPMTRIWMMSWRIGDGAVKRWHPTDPPPHDLLAHVAARGVVAAHNAGFERSIWNITMRNLPQCRDWPRLEIAQQDCTMARALAIHLPASLEELGPVLGLTERKDDEGSRLMKKMMRPRRINEDGSLTWWDSAENIERLGRYCDRDVEVESEIDKRVPPLSAEERELWERDQRINDLGVTLDVATVTRLADVKTEAIKIADERMCALTNGAVKRHTEVGKIVAWLNARGVPCQSLGKDFHDDLKVTAEMLGDDDARKVVELRGQATKTSTAKLNAMLDVVCADGRARGLFAYHRALTGRFGGMKVQPQNLPRVDEDTELPEVMRALDVVRGFNDPDPRALHDALERESSMPVMILLSKMLRSMFVATPGTFLIGADFSGIEARVNAWMAGEQWKLDAFAAYDAGTGPDLYKVAYSRTFEVPVESVTKLQRQKGGKTQELALGYQGSCGAWLRFDRDPTVLTALVMDRYHDDDRWRVAAEQHDRLKFHNGLSRDQWTAIKVVVNGWRSSHPNITQSWWDMQDAILEAVETPGTKVPVLGGKLSYLVADGFLWTRLPSGKLLAYASPRIVEKKDDWLVDEEGNAVPAGEMAEDEIAMRVAAGAKLEIGKRRTQVCYQGKSQAKGRGGRWGRQYLYGGVLANNAVQGTARELLRFAMKNVEEAGFGVQNLHVHDECVNEIAEHMADGAEARYEEIMSILPPWLSGLPLAAKAWSSGRYVK